jgi:hypothetical protein
MSPFDKTFLPRPFIKKPIKGRSGIRKIKFFMFYKLQAVGYKLQASLKACSLKLVAWAFLVF